MDLTYVSAMPQENTLLTSLSMIGEDSFKSV
jgi:hypothetical protein